MFGGGGGGVVVMVMVWYEWCMVSRCVEVSVTLTTTGRQDFHPPQSMDFPPNNLSTWLPAKSLPTFIFYF